MKKVFLNVMAVHLLILYNFSQLTPQQIEEYKTRKNIIRNETFKIEEFKKEGKFNPATVKVIKILNNENIYLLYDTLLSTNNTAYVRPDILNISRALNYELFKIVDSIYPGNEHNYSSISLPKFKKIESIYDCMNLLNNSIHIAEIDLNIPIIFKKELVKRNFIDSTVDINSNIILSDLYISGFSLTPVLNSVLNYISSKMGDSTTTISFSDANKLVSMKDCIDLLKKSSSHPELSEVGCIAEFFNEHVRNWFTFAKSSDELYKLPYERASSKCGYNTSSAQTQKKSYQYDFLGEFNALGIIEELFVPNKKDTTFKKLPSPIRAELGFYIELHGLRSSGKDTIRSSSYGSDISETILFDWANTRLNFDEIISNTEDFIAHYKGAFIRINFNIGFQPSNLTTSPFLKYIVPRYEPFGPDAGSHFEPFSYMWSPVFGFEHRSFYPLSNNKSINAFIFKLTGTIFLLQRFLEFDGLWQVSSNSQYYSGDTLSGSKKSNYIDFTAKLNILSNKSNMLKGLSKDLRLSIGFEYQEGQNFALGTHYNQIQRSITLEIGF